jgi:hypothetical protein
VIRRNTDESLRDLERRVEGGDRQAALALWREQSRSGLVREDYAAPVFLVDTSLGQVTLTPLDERTIRIEIGQRDVPVGAGPMERRRRVDLAPMVLNRVPCRGFVTYHYYDEALFREIVGERQERAWSYAESTLKSYVPGFAPYGAAQDDRGRWEVEESLSLKRVDRAERHYGVSGVEAITLLTPITNRWAATNRRIMLEAEAGSTSNQIIRQREDYEKALEALRTEEEKISDLMVHEAQVRSALRSGAQ